MRHATLRSSLLVVCGMLAATVAGALPVVESSCTLLDLSGVGNKTAKLTLQPSDAGAGASGTVRATPAGETTALQVDVRGLRPAEETGFVHLTHVLWAVDGDGSYTSLGELDVKNGRARMGASVPGTRFGLLVTAEPYFSVSRPSTAVLLTAVVEGRAARNVNVDATTCELVDSGYYTFGRNDVAVALTLKRDAKTPLDLLQARHAYKIAELAGGAEHQPDALGEVAARLLDAERAQSAKPGGAAVLGQSREAVIAAEQVRVQSELAARDAETARREAEKRAEQERAAARAAAEKRQAEEQEAARLAAERREQQRLEMEALAAERQAQEAELARLAAEREALRQQIAEEAQRHAEAMAAPPEVAEPGAPAEAEQVAEDAADASLEAERARLEAERAQLEAQRIKQQADLEAERARIEAERATLRAQLAEENVAREREATATVRAEAEEARRQAEQARIEAETAKREAEIIAERARLDVERAQLEAQRKTAESEAAMRQRLQTEAAEQSAIRTEEQRQAEMERIRRQLELEMQQRQLEQQREALTAERLAQQSAVDDERAQLDAEREEIVAQLAADQARLAAERAELERARREDEARREAEAKAAEEERARQLAEGRAALQQELEAERARLQEEMRAEIAAERARLRENFEKQSRQIEQDAAAAEAARVRQAEADRLARRERLLGQLTQVLDARDTERGLLVNLAGVSFAAGQHELQPEAREKLARLAGILLANPTLTATIEGHTDSTGSEEGNLALSERRAYAVRDYLVSQGVPAGSLTATGVGASSPIASNDTAEGRRANRRIEVLISGAAIDR